MQRAIEEALEYEGNIDKIADEFGYDFEDRSIMRWAINEIIKLLKKRQGVPPIILIDGFKDTMEAYAQMKRHSNYIFYVAYMVAEELTNKLIT